MYFSVTLFTIICNLSPCPPYIIRSLGLHIHVRVASLLVFFFLTPLPTEAPLLPLPPPYLFLDCPVFSHLSSPVSPPPPSYEFMSYSSSPPTPSPSDVPIPPAFFSTLFQTSPFPLMSLPSSAVSGFHLVARIYGDGFCSIPVDPRPFQQATVLLGCPIMPSPVSLCLSELRSPP